VLALCDQILPPTINQEAPDPECDLDYVPNAARKASVHYALSNSFGLAVQTLRSFSAGGLANSRFSDLNGSLK